MSIKHLNLINNHFYNKMVCCLPNSMLKVRLFVEKWRHKISKIKSLSAGLWVGGSHNKVEGGAYSQSPPFPMFGVLLAKVSWHKHHHNGVNKGQRFALSVAPLFFYLAVACVKCGLEIASCCGLDSAFLELWALHLIKYKRYNQPTKI